jgi:hypothetical protein
VNVNPTELPNEDLRRDVLDAVAGSPGVTAAQLNTILGKVNSTDLPNEYNRGHVLAAVAGSPGVTAALLDAIRGKVNPTELPNENYQRDVLDAVARSPVRGPGSEKRHVDVVSARHATVRHNQPEHLIPDRRGLDQPGAMEPALQAKPVENLKEVLGDETAEKPLKGIEETINEMVKKSAEELGDDRVEELGDQRVLKTPPNRPEGSKTKVTFAELPPPRRTEPEKKAEISASTEKRKSSLPGNDGAEAEINVVSNTFKRGYVKPWKNALDSLLEARSNNQLTNDELIERLASLKAKLNKPKPGGVREAALLEYGKAVLSAYENQWVKTENIKDLLPDLGINSSGNWLKETFPEKYEEAEKQHAAKEHPLSKAVYEEPVFELQEKSSSSQDKGGPSTPLGNAVDLNRKGIRSRTWAFENGDAKLVKASNDFLLDLLKRRSLDTAQFKDEVAARNNNGVPGRLLALLNGHDKAIEADNELLIQARGIGVLDDAALKKLLAADRKMSDFGALPRGSRGEAAFLEHGKAVLKAYAKGWLTSVDLKDLEPTPGWLEQNLPKQYQEAERAHQQRKSAVKSLRLDRGKALAYGKTAEIERRNSFLLEEIEGGLRNPAEFKEIIAAWDSKGVPGRYFALHNGHKEAIEADNKLLIQARRMGLLDNEDLKELLAAGGNIPDFGAPPPDSPQEAAILEHGKAVLEASRQGWLTEADLQDLEPAPGWLKENEAALQEAVQEQKGENLVPQIEVRPSTSTQEIGELHRQMKAGLNELEEKIKAALPGPSTPDVSFVHDVLYLLVVGDRDNALKLVKEANPQFENILPTFAAFLCDKEPWRKYVLETYPDAFERRQKQANRVLKDTERDAKKYDDFVVEPALFAARQEAAPEYIKKAVVADLTDRLIGTTRILDQLGEKDCEILVDINDRRLVKSKEFSVRLVVPQTGQGNMPSNVASSSITEMHCLEVELREKKSFFGLKGKASALFSLKRKPSAENAKKKKMFIGLSAGELVELVELVQLLGKKPESFSPGEKIDVRISSKGRGRDGEKYHWTINKPASTSKGKKQTQR